MFRLAAGSSELMIRGVTTFPVMLKCVASFWSLVPESVDAAEADGAHGHLNQERPTCGLIFFVGISVLGLMTQESVYKQTFNDVSTFTDG